MDRPTPILHVVYAGRGDAMYVEYSDDNGSQLMAVDGGPRDNGSQRHGANINQSDNVNVQMVVTPKHDKLGYRYYYKFFASAGKSIFYDKMKRRTSERFTLSSLLCTHPHEDHVEGLLDLLQQAGDTVDPGIGFILPSLKEKGRSHLSEVYRILVQDSPKESPKMTPSKLKHEEFSAGSIVYPNDQLILLRPRSNQDANIQYSNFMEMFTNIEEYVRNLNGSDAIYNSINLNSKNNLNLASILLYIKGIKGGGIFLTGDNNGNLIHHYISMAIGDVKHINNPLFSQKRPHFAIYKISHHGGSEDSQIKVGDYYDSLDKVCEFALFGTLSLDFLNETPAYCTKIIQKSDVPLDKAFKWLNLQLWTILKLNDVDGRKVYFRELKKLVKGFSTDLKCEKYPKILCGRPLPRFAWQELMKKLDNAMKEFITLKNTKNELFQAFFKKYTAEKKVKMNNDKEKEKVEKVWMSRLWWQKWWRGSTIDSKGEIIKRKAPCIFEKVVCDLERTISSRAFFSSFTADAYVVSSNGVSYPHPHPTTITGLAWALKNEQRRATLYLTSAYSFKEEYFTSQAKICYQDPDKLCEYLKIRYPGNSIYFSLTAEPEEQKKVERESDKRLVRDKAGALAWKDINSNSDQYIFAYALHDIDKVTKPLKMPMGDKMKENFQARNELMESHNYWKVIERTMATVFYIKSDTPYLKGCVSIENGTLVFQETLPIDEVQDEPVRIRFRSIWEALIPLISNGKNIFEIHKDDEQDMKNVIKIQLDPVRLRTSLDSIDGPFYIYWRTTIDKENKAEKISSFFSVKGKVKVVSFVKDYKLSDSFKKGKKPIQFQIIAVPKQHKPANDFVIPLQTKKAKKKLLMIDLEEDHEKDPPKINNEIVEEQDMSKKEDTKSIQGNLIGKRSPEKEREEQVMIEEKGAGEEEDKEEDKKEDMYSEPIKKKFMQETRVEMATEGIREEAFTFMTPIKKFVEKKVFSKPPEEAQSIVQSSEAIDASSEQVFKPRDSSLTMNSIEENFLATSEFLSLQHSNEEPTLTPIEISELQKPIEEISSKADTVATNIDDYNTADENMSDFIDDHETSLVPFKKGTDGITAMITKHHTIQDYITARALELPSKPNILINTVVEFLTEMLSENDLRSLNLNSFERNLFSLPIEQTISTLDFTTDTLAVTVQTAVLQILVPESTTLDIGGTSNRVTHAEAHFNCGIDEDIDLHIYISTAHQNIDGFLDEQSNLLIRKHLRRSTQDTLLFKVISAQTTKAGIDEAEVINMNVVDVLAIVVASDQIAVNLFYQRIPFALSGILSFLQAKPDWGNSTAKATYNSLKNIDIEQANIIFDLASIGMATSFTIGFLTVSLSSIRIEVLRARRPTQKVFLKATVSFILSGEVDSKEEDDVAEEQNVEKKSLQLSIDAQMTVAMHSGSPNGEIETTFLLGKADSFNDVLKSLGQSSKFSELTMIAVPFTIAKGKEPSIENHQTMDKLKLKPGTFGFVLRQPLMNPCQLDYILDRVFASVDLADWQEWLPIKFPRVIKNGSVIVQLDIIDPFISKLRRVRVDIDFILQLSIKSGSINGKEDIRDIKTSLSAIPLAAYNDHEYRIDLNIAESYKSLSILELTSAIGLSDVIDSLTQEVPLIQNILDKVRVRSLSVGISPSSTGKGWEFSDWSIEVDIAGFDLIPNGKIRLRDMIILLQRRTMITKEISASMKGNLSLFTPTKNSQDIVSTTLVGLDLRTPTRIAGGQLWLQIPEGVSIQDMLNVFSLGEFNHIPIIGQMLDTQLKDMRLQTLPYNSTGKNLDIQSFSIELFHEEIIIGPMTFTNLEVSFEWIATEISDEASSIALNIRVSFLDQDVLGDLVYIRSSEQRKFSASLVPTFIGENQATIGRMLRACLPSNIQDLDILVSITDRLMLQRAEIGFTNNDDNDVTSKNLKLAYFEFHILDNTPLEVQRLTLQELRVVYKDEEIKTNELAESLPQDTIVAKDFNKPRQTSVSLLASLQKKDRINGDLKARIELFVKVEKEVKTIAFSLVPIEKNSLTVSKLLSLLNFSDDSLKYPHPEECPSIFSIVVDGLVGELSNEDKVIEKESTLDEKLQVEESVDSAKKSLQIRKFSFAAHTEKSIEVVKNPLIMIKDIVLHIVYDNTKVVEPPSSNLNGILKGKIVISGLIIEVSFGFDSNAGAWVFAAETPLSNILSQPENKSIDKSSTSSTKLLDLASSTGMDSSSLLDLESTKMKSTITPNTIGVRIRLVRPRQIEVWAIGDDVWVGDICGVVLEIKKLGVFFHYTEGDLSGAQLIRGQPKCEGYIFGKINLKGWEADACMSIGPQRNAILTAKLRKENSSTESNDLNLFKTTIDDVAKNGDAGSWSDLVPSFEGVSYKIGKSYATLFADVKNQKLLISASIEGLGSAFMMSTLVTEGTLDVAKEKKSKRNYIFLLEVQQLSQLWSNMDSDVDSQFDIRRISIQIFGLKTSMTQLKKQLEEFNKPEPDYTLLDQPDSTVDLDTDMDSAIKNSERIHNMTSEPSKESQKDTAEQKPEVELTSVATASQILQDLPEKDLEPGAWFFAELNIGAIRSTTAEQQDKKEKPEIQNMTDVILLDATKGQQDSSRIRLYALIPKKESKNGSQIEYGIDVRNLIFFDGMMTINGNGKYFPSTKALKLSATISLKLDPQDLQTLDLRVNLDMDKTKTAFFASIDYDSNQVISNPFNGSMFNVSLTHLSIEGSSTLKEKGSGVIRQCIIRGVATLGSMLDKRLGCMIHFLDSKPVVVVIDYSQKVINNSSSREGQDLTLHQQTPMTIEKADSTMPIYDMFQSIIQPNSDTDLWPSDTVDDFVLREAYLSYNNTDKIVSIDKQNYMPGYYAYGLFDLFEMPFSVSLLIDKSKKGILLSGSYTNVIDLGLLKFTSFQSIEDKINIDGPTLNLDTRGQTKGIKFGVSSGLTLLDKPGFFLSLEYKPDKDKNKREYSGSAMFKGEVLGGILDNPKIDFAYKKGRWSITNLQLRRDATWDAENPSNGIPFDLDKALQMGSKSDGDCKELVDFVVSKIIQMRFTFSLSLPSMKQSDMMAATNSEAISEVNEQANNSQNSEKNENKNNFKFIVSWWIDITIAGYNVGKIKLTDFDFTVSLQKLHFTLQGLIDFLWEQVLSVENMSEVGRKVLQNPEVLGKLLTKVAIEKLTDEIVESLLCRKPEQPKGKENLKERTKEVQDKKKQDMDKKVEDSKKDYDKVKDRSKPNSGDGGGSGGGGGGGGGGGLPIPIPIPVPFIPIPLPFPIPLPIPALPSIPPGKEKPIPVENNQIFSLIDLIRLYLIGNGKLESVTAEQLLEGLGKKMLNHPDKDYGSYATAMYDQVQKRIAEAKVNRNEAKSSIEERMTLLAERMVAGYYADQAESTIAIQLIAALPSPLAVFEDDYQYVRWQLFATDQDKEPTEADKDHILTFKGTERVIVTQNEEFRYLKNVFLFVRMWIIMESEEFASPQWYKIALVHNKPWLRPTLGVYLNYEDVTDSIKVTLPPSDIIPGDWTVDLVDEAATDSDSLKTNSTLFSSCFATPDIGPSEYRISVSSLGFNIQPTYKTIRARATQKASDPNQYHESLPSLSFQSLSLTPAPKGLDASFVGKGKVIVRWLRDETLDASAYVITTVRKDTQTIIQTVQTPSQVIELGFIETELTLPEITASAEGEILSIRVSAKVSNRINLISEKLIEVTVPTIIKIEPESNFHMESGILTLVVSSNTPFTRNTIFTVLRAELGLSDKMQELEVLSQCLNDRISILRLRPNNIDGEFTVKIGTHTTQTWILEPWKLMDYPQFTHLSAIATNEKHILVTWDAGQDGLIVDVSVYSETLLSTENGEGHPAGGILAYGTTKANEKSIELGKNGEFIQLMKETVTVHILIRAQNRKRIISNYKLRVEF